jgi:hypothetical protein
MDWADIARRAAAAREFTHEVDGRRFTLRLPTHDEMRISVLSHGTPGVNTDVGLAAWERIGRELIERAVVGWSGVRFSDLLPGETDEPLEWAAEGVPLLLDAQPQWCLSLRAALMKGITDRAARIETAQKN